MSYGKKTASFYIKANGYYRKLKIGSDYSVDNIYTNDDFKVGDRKLKVSLIPDITNVSVNNYDSYTDINYPIVYNSNGYYYTDSITGPNATIDQTTQYNIYFEGSPIAVFGGSEYKYSAYSVVLLYDNMLNTYFENAELNETDNSFKVNFKYGLETNYKIIEDSLLSTGYNKQELRAVVTDDGVEKQYLDVNTDRTSSLSFGSTGLDKYWTFVDIDSLETTGDVVVNYVNEEFRDKEITIGNNSKDEEIQIYFKRYFFNSRFKFSKSKFTKPNISGSIIGNTANITVDYSGNPKAETIRIFYQSSLDSSVSYKDFALDGSGYLNVSFNNIIGETRFSAKILSNKYASFESGRTDYYTFENAKIFPQYRISDYMFYTQSDTSDSILLIGYLDKPLVTLSEDGFTVSWNKISGATSYSVYDGDTLLNSITETTYNLPAYATSIGNHRIRVIPRIGSNISFSNESDSLYTSYNMLTSPTIKWDTSGSKFNLVVSDLGKATGVTVYYGPYTSASSGADTQYGQSVSKLDNEDTINLSFKLDVINEYIVQVRPVSKSYRLEDGYYKIYYSVDPSTNIEVRSNSIYYNNIKLSTPVLSFDRAQSLLQWNAVEYTKHYSVYINESLKTSTVNTSYTILESFDNAISYIVADAIDPVITESEYNIYFNSDKSNEVVFGKLLTPVLTSESNKLIWNEINNADYYEIYDGDVLFYSTNLTEFTVSPVQHDYFEFSVVACSNREGIASSNNSNVINMEFFDLPAPEIQFNTESRLLTIFPKTGGFDVSESDLSYEIYIDNSLFTTTVEKELYLPDDLNGSIEIYTRTISENPFYLKSNYSNTVRVSLGTTYKYAIKIFDNQYRERAEKLYEVQLPINLCFTIDDSLDTGSVVLKLNDDPIPFEAFTDCTLQVYSDDGSGIISFENNFDMIIEEDKVTEVQQGNIIKYKHNLILIERTKLLEKEILSDISITQPQNYVSAIYGNETSSYELGSSQNLISKNFLMPWYRLDVTLFSMILYIVEGNVDDRNVTVPYKYYNVSDQFILPKLNTKKIDLTAIGYSSTSPGVTNFPTVESDKDVILNYQPSIKPYMTTSDSVSATDFNQSWWIIENTDVSNDENGNIIINSEKDYDTLVNYAKRNNPTVSGTSAKDELYSFKKAGVYDIVFKMDGKDIYLLDGGVHGVTVGGPDYPFGSEEGPFRLEFAGDGQYQVIIKKTEKSSPKLTEPLYMVFRNIVVNNSEENSNVYSTNSKVTYLVDAIDKILYSQQPLEWSNGSGIISKQKYVLDNDIRTYLNSPKIVSPEFTWTGGKSLYEVLAEIGREFNGIPRLLKSKYNSSTGSYDDNVITFDILSINRNTDPVNKSSLSEKMSSIDNHSTEFISPISNLISEDSIEYYPSKTGWVSPKSTDEDNAYVMRDNMGIVLPKNIFKLETIEVAEIDDSGNINKIPVKLENYTVESTIFDTLNDDQNGKGKALYWTQGDNKIYNIGALKAESEAEVIWGLSSSQYVIQNIIDDTLGRQPDPQKLLYRVSYIPYSDVMLKTEQSNISGLSNFTASVLNQENNTITDKKFGSSAQRQIERLGNNSIIRSYQHSSLLECPTLGNTIEFNDDIYYCDVINYNINNNFIETVCEFSKNFNKINPRMGIDAEYRQYEIYADQFVERNLNINNYCYVSHTIYNDFKANSQRRCNYSLSDILCNSLLNSAYNKPETFYINTMQKADEYIADRLRYTSYTSNIKGNVGTDGFLIPANGYIFNNSVLFTGKMYDNFSAGIKADTIEDGSWLENIENSMAELFNKDKINKFIQKDCRYVNDLGKADIIGICLGSVTDDSIYSGKDINGNAVSYNKYRSIPSVSFQNSPELFFKKSTSLNVSDPLLSAQYYVDKDNRESFVFNYQLHFLTYDKNLFIHRALVKYLFNNNKYSHEVNPILVACTDYINTHEQIPSTVLYEKISDITVRKLGNKVYIDNNTEFVPSRNYKSLAYIWPDTKEIIISEKKDMKAGVSYSIDNLYFNFSDEKISFKKN